MLRDEAKHSRANSYISVFEKRRRILNVAIFPREIGFAPTFDILNILSPQSCQITFALINIRYFAAIFFVTRPKPPYGRQGLAGLWGKDAVWRITLLTRGPN